MTQEATAAATIARIEARLGSLPQKALRNRQRKRLGETDALLTRLPQELAQLRAHPRLAGRMRGVSSLRCE